MSQAISNQVKIDTGLLAVMIHAGAYTALLEKASRERVGCLEVEQAFLLQFKQEARPGDLVFLASLRLPRFTDQWTTS